jgi:predicted RNase H-like nuclease (RuvC/YqgF family)
MTAQATAAAAFAVAALLLVAAAVLLVVLLLRDRRAGAERHAEEVKAAYGYGDQRVEAVVRRERELEATLTAATNDLHRARADVALLTTKLEAADRRLEDLELELARRRAGAVLEGDTVALTTPDDRTVRGIVRQTFDNGSLLLGGAVVYVERPGRAGEVDVQELEAGDVVVPAYRWAQKLPPREDT